jgi:Fe-S cluster biosynthesis and repair protein YggX
MTDTIFCQKLQQDLPALDFEPYPGELGAKIFQSISANAWQMWLEHQTMLINEYRLNMLEAEARKFLKEEMEKFLFGKGSDKPEGFVATE